MTFLCNASFRPDRPRARAAFAGVLVALLASACSPSSSTASPPGAAAPRQDVAPMQSSATPAATATPPDAGSVLYFIYQVDGDGATSYEVANGSVATFWFGHAFDLAGTKYYTGFAWNTPAKYGKPGEDDAGPESQVTLTEATFTLTGTAEGKPWVFKGMERSIGKIGAYGNPPTIDTTRKPVEHRTAAGKLLLAVPTRVLDGGSSISGYDLLAFNPHYEQGSNDDQVWAYLGSVITGEDNAAACDDGQVMPCISSEGEIAFGNAAGSDLPTIAVKHTGTTFSGPDATRPMGAEDTTRYAYDPATKAYVKQ